MEKGLFNDHSNFSYFRLLMYKLVVTHHFQGDHWTEYLFLWDKRISKLDWLIHSKYITGLFLDNGVVSLYGIC